MRGGSVQKLPEVIEHFSAGRAQEAVVSDLDEPLWEHVLKESAEELCGRKSPARPLAGRAVLESERDRSIVERFDAVGGDGNPTEGGSEGLDDLVTGSDRCTVSHPVLFPHLGRSMIEQPSVGQRLLELASEECGEGADGNKPVSIARGEPLRAIRREGSPWDNVMEMRRRGHLPGPGLQDPPHPDLTSKIFGILGEFFQGSGGGLKQDVVQEFLVRAGFYPATHRAA